MKPLKRGRRSHRDLLAYGSKLLNRSVSGQLGGSITYNWSVKGVVVTLKLDGAKLAK